MSSTVVTTELPSAAELEEELDRVSRKSRFRRKLASTVGVLLVVAAVAVLIASYFMPVLQIYGDSMSPSLKDGDVVVAWAVDDFETGDVVAFHYNNKVLVKRVIASAGDWVNISKGGVVSVNGVALEEPYVKDLSLGNCNIELPYQVPESQIFVLGDHRSVSIDSRNTAVGCVAEDQLVGKLLIRVWPFEEMCLL